MRSSTPIAAPRMCSARAPRSASLANDTCTSRPRAASTIPPKETSCHSRFGARRISPSLRRTRPGTLIPIPTRGAAGGAPSTTRLMRAATEAPTCQASPSLWTGACARSSTRPPRPILATTARSTPRSTAMTKGPSAAMATPLEGRPAPCRTPPPTGVVLSEMPSDSSSLTSPAMVLRLSPIRLVSSAREIWPALWTCRSSVPRLWRRTASWLVPRPERRCGLMCST